jgi:hypothetical protein
MPHDHVLPPEDVQHLGQQPTPDEIGAQIEAHAKRAAEAQRTMLEAHVEIAKLLAILTDHHGYKSRRFVTFALAHGVPTRTDAYDLLHLAEDADKIVAHHAAATRDDPDHEWPSWREALHDIKHGDDDEPEEGGYWITPPDVYEKLDAEFHFDCDPFPYPRPDGYDALAEDQEWGQCSYVNASFRRAHADGRGLTHVIRKAIAESKKGKTMVLPIPITDALALLLTSGAEFRPLGRVRWLHTRTGEPYSQPGNCALFILRGSPPA